jgi:energy-coupling factor transporter ATP-binding protein EcfA2
MEIININSNTLKEKKYLFHSSDIHIENNEKRNEAYKLVFDRFIEQIKKYDVDECIVCLLGDIIDFKNNVTISGVNMLMYFLNLIGNICETVIISGNHDANINDINSLDLIECCCNNINTKYNIHYLKKSGLYKLNNVIFSVVSIFDRKIIEPEKIKKKDEILVALYHGFVIGDNINIEKLPYQINDKIFRAKDFKGYDLTLLGDLHGLNFIKNNIAYCSSLIQRNYGEKMDGHGIIIWDLITKKGKFVEIVNDYGLLTKIIKDGKIDMKNEKLPKNVSIKFKLDNSDKTIIDEEIEKIGKKCNIIGIPKIEKINSKFFIETIGGIKISKFDMTDKKLVLELIKEYMIKTLKYNKDDKKINDILKIHDNYYKNIKVPSRSNKKIKFVNLKFDNVYTYGQSNIFRFDYDENENILIKGKNGFGKSSIIDIICYILYDKTLRGGNDKTCILNTAKKEYSIELYLYVDDIYYKIIKTGRRKFYNSIYTYEHNCKICKNNIEIREFGKKTQQEYIENLIGLDFEEFIFFCLMPTNSKYEIINRSNIEKKELIAKILNIDYFDDICDLVKKDLEKKKILYEKESKEYKEILNKYDEKDLFDQKLFILKEKKLIVNENKLKVLKEEINNLTKEIKYIENEEDNDKKIILKDIDYLKKQIINDEKNLKENLLELEKNRKEKKNIIIKKNIQDKIFDICSDKKNKNTKILNDVLYDLIKENIDIVTKIHDSEIELLEEKNSIEKNIKDNNHELKINNKRLDNYNKYKKYIDNNVKIQKKIKKKEEFVIKLEKDIENISADIEDMKKQKEILVTEEEFEYAKNQMLKKTNEIELLSLYLEIINISAFPSSIFKIVCKEIEDIINNLLAQFDVEYRMKIDLISKKIGKNISTVIDLYKIHRIGQSIGQIDASYASNSENFNLNLLFKIAMQQYFNISIPPFIIIDEHYEKIDNEKIFNISDFFDIMHSVYKNIFIISHIYQIEQACSNIVNIGLEGNSSYIRN